MNNTHQILATEIAGFYKDKRGRKHHGWHVLNDHGLLTHPERLAVITIGQINSGAKVAETAIRVGESVANTNERQMIWREKFDAGLWLITVAVESGLYEVRRSDGTAPVSPHSTEPYRIYYKGAQGQQPLGYLSVDAPFPPWTSNIEEDGRQLLQSDCYTPEVNPNKTWVNAVNRLESIGFRINPTMLEVAQRVGIQTTNETKRIQQKGYLRESERLLGSDFYHRAHVDQRGRIYISRSPINFQQGDLSRGLIEFAEGVLLTEEGREAIYLHIANCYGEKGDIQGRIQFAKDNHATWIEYARGSSDEWLNASEPFQLLRACIELHNVKVGDVSHLIVPIDQSCSGLAWQSIVMGDTELAEMTNLQGGYQDLYTIIGERMDLSASAKERRNIIKKSVMPRSYGSSAKTIAGDLRDWARLNPEEAPYLNTLNLELVENSRGDKVPSPELRKIAETAIRTLASVAPATKDYAKSVRRFYRSRLESGLPYVQWLAPSGFFCRLRKEVADKVHGSLSLSTGRIQIVAYAPTGEIDTGKMRRASLAGVIHSLDASLVHITLSNSGHQIVPVHDSFGSHPSNVFKTQKQLMSTLLEIDKMDVSLAIEGQDHGENVTWHDLQSVRRMNDWVIATQFPKRVGTPPDTAFSYELNKPPVVYATATNVFS